MDRPAGLKHTGKALATLTALLALTACGSLHPPAPPVPPEKGTAFGQQMPVAKLHLLCTTAALLPALLSAAEDPALAFSGLHRVANGCLSISIKDHRGHWLHGVECGGRILLPGTPGEICSLEIVNETDRPIDIAVAHDGTTPATGTLRLKAHARKGLPLPWTTISGPEALFRFDVAAQRGVVGITVYPVSGAQNQWASERLAPSPTGGPQRKFVPLAAPFEYR